MRKTKNKNTPSPQPQRLSSQSHDSSSSNPKSTQSLRRSVRFIEVNGKGKAPLYNGRAHPMDQFIRRGGGKGRSKDLVQADAKIQPEAKVSNAVIEVKKEAAVENGTNQVSNATSAQVAEDVTHPDRRRSARASFPTSSPNYDMKYHPMDSMIRPRAVAKRLTSRMLAVSIPLSHPSVTQPKAQPSETAFDNTPERSSQSHVPLIENSHTERRTLDWADLEPIDRFVYILQKGAPIQGNTLPLGWIEVAQALFEKGYISESVRDDKDWLDSLKIRYEIVLAGVAAFFGADDQATDQRDWVLFRAEGPDVFGQKSGMRYWKHRKDSMVPLVIQQEDNPSKERNPNIPPPILANPLPKIRNRKRKLKAIEEIKIYEDDPEKPPPHPAKRVSPGTDIQEENLSLSRGSVRYTGSPLNRMYHPSRSTPSSRRLIRRISVSGRMSSRY